MTRLRILTAVVMVAASSLFTGCGGGDATVTPNVINGAIAARSNLIESAFYQWVQPRAVAPVRVASFGQTTTADLESLQYFIQSIQLCAGVTMNGTGYDNTSGCVTLYEQPDTAYREVGIYNTYTVTEAAADTDANHYIDFMTAAGKAKLATATSVSAGTYNFALLNFMRPIKMKATFKDGSGNAQFYTKTATGGQIVAGTTDSAGRETEYVRPSGTNAGSAELMTYMLNNGGVVVPLPTPFVVASGDNVVLDFVFNPVAFATASSANAGACTATAGAAAVDEANCVTFDLPYAKMAPVPRKAGETTKKETYLVDYGNNTKARIELYYNSADTTKAIRGIDVAIVGSATATEVKTNIISSYSASETSGLVTLYGYNSTTGGLDAPSLVGLVRGADTTTGLVIKCNVFSGGPCVGAADYSTTATYEGESTIGG